MNHYSAGNALRRSLDQQRINRALRQRLTDKICDFDREAARLDLRGQADAAAVLRKESAKLRLITRGNLA